MIRKYKAKSTKVETEHRVMQVLDWLLTGADRGLIIKNVRKEWGLTSHQTDVYINKAKQLIKDNTHKDIDFEMNKALMQYDKIYLQASMKKDWNCCRNILKDRTELLGMRRLNLNHEFPQYWSGIFGAIGDIGGDDDQPEKA